jgi:hypothetical protein
MESCSEVLLRYRVFCGIICSDNLKGGDHFVLPSKGSSGLAGKTRHSAGGDGQALVLQRDRSGDSRSATG